MSPSDNDFQLAARRLIGACPNLTGRFDCLGAKDERRSQTSGAD
jgi:hypothetical protein